ncbi:MAG: cytochrome c [Deltaproteobacteria bacterium]|nr:cytochrome c [Deltaproteobacteria bacterium]
MRTTFLLLLALGLLSGCSFNERVDAILELTPDAANGAVIWGADCERCHGADGRGNDLGPNLISELHHGDKQFLTWILDGLGDEMPAFPDYTDQEAADVLEHIHVLAE